MWRDAAHCCTKPANVTQGYPNVAQLTMTAEFYRQDALTAPNVTHTDLTWHNAARHCSDSKRNITSGRRAKRAALLWSFLFLAVTAVTG